MRFFLVQDASVFSIVQGKLRHAKGDMLRKGTITEATAVKKKFFKGNRQQESYLLELPNGGFIQPKAATIYLDQFFGMLGIDKTDSGSKINWLFPVVGLSGGMLIAWRTGGQIKRYAIGAAVGATIGLGINYIMLKN